MAKSTRGGKEGREDVLQKKQNGSQGFLEVYNTHASVEEKKRREGKRE